MRVDVVAFDLGEIMFEFVKLVKAVECVEVVCNQWSPVPVRQQENQTGAGTPGFG